MIVIAAANPITGQALRSEKICSRTNPKISNWITILSELIQMRLPSPSCKRSDIAALIANKPAATDTSHHCNVSSPLGIDPSVCKRKHSIRHPQNLLTIVAGPDPACPVVLLNEPRRCQLFKPVGRLRVQRRGGLIEQQHNRVQGNGSE